MFKSENTHYQKLWTSLERKEKHPLRATKTVTEMCTGCFKMVESCHICISVTKESL